MRKLFLASVSAAALILNSAALADMMVLPGGSGTSSGSVILTSGAPTSSTYTLAGTVSFSGGTLAGVPVAIYKNGALIGTAQTSATGAFSYAATGVFNSDVFTASVPSYLIATPVSAAISVPSQDVLVSQIDYTQGSLAAGDSDTRGGSIAAWTNSSGLLQTPGAAANTARFDYGYGGSAWTANGLLIEAADTNQILYSNTFNNSAWSLGAATLTANAATSPDGTADAWSLAATATNALHAVYVTNTFSIAAGNHTFSVYAKPGAYTYAVLSCNAGASNWAAAIFNLNTGAVTQTSIAVSGTLTLAGQPSATNVGGGWYRYFLNVNMSSAGSGACAVQLGNAATQSLASYGNSSFLGTAGSNIYIYGAQFASNSVSSYIPTTSASVSRGADAFANSSWSTSSVVAETMDEVSGLISRNAYAAGSFSPASNKWYRRICVYPSGADTAYLANQLNIGAACY